MIYNKYLVSYIKHLICDIKYDIRHLIYYTIYDNIYGISTLLNLIPMLYKISYIKYLTTEADILFI